MEDLKTQFVKDLRTFGGVDEKIVELIVAMFGAVYTKGKMDAGEEMSVALKKVILDTHD